MNTGENSGKDHHDSINSSIRAIEERIRPEIFQEFYELLESDESESKCSPETSKHLGLAKSGTIESYRKLEEIVSGGKLTGKESEFAILAMHFCRFKVENELLDIEMDMISAGLGGSGNRLRYYIALTCTEGKVADHIQDMDKVFKRILQKNDSILEELTDHGFYVSGLILVSINYAIGPILEEIFKECTFLSKEYYTTNVEIPTEDRIRYWLDGNLDDEIQSA